MIFPSIANLIGGIAYHNASDMLVLVAKDGVWQSLKGEEFVHTVANDGLRTGLNPTIGGGWMLKNGAFLFSSEGDHLFS